MSANRSTKPKQLTHTLRSPSSKPTDFSFPSHPSRKSPATRAAMSPASGAGAGSRRVTISSMSCRGVKAFVPFQKPPLYAAVSLGGRREKTPPDADGGENPDWEGAVVAFDLDLDAGKQQQEQELVRFEVKAQVPLLGTKVVGTASVPVADLAPGGAAPRHVSYQVRAPDGKPNGTLSFAYAVGGGGATTQPQVHTVGPVPVTAHPAPPSTANFAAHGGGYPPPPPLASPPQVPPGSLYPPLQDLLPSSTYRPPRPPSTLPSPTTTTNPHFPEPNGSCHYPPPPPAPYSVYPPPPPSDSCTSGPAQQNISSYPPPPSPSSSYPPPPPSPSSYPPPPPPSGYPPLFSNSASPTGTYPPPFSNSASPTGTYPPPPPEAGSAYPPSSAVDRALPFYTAPSSTYPSPRGGSLYPAAPELDGGSGSGAARTPHYYYPPPGARYP